MTSPTYNLSCIGFTFLLCFSIGFGRKNLQEKHGDTQITPKHVEATAQVTNFGAKDISSNIALGEVGSQEMHHIHIGTGPDSSLREKQDDINSKPTKVVRGTVSITFSFPIIKIPAPNTDSKTVATINKLNEDKIQGIVITPTKTHEFGLSPGNDGIELEYSQKVPAPRTEY
ncbi:hypothetical protein EUTSA_v10009401mg [Eutrema salsugineum]|uniref:Uncharacterized protein n=1 Tax=Eutrema salsugineum TaxID=72664 RepID=V4L3H8_EUTSA|nr:uncharacterized protein LOC18992483 [Eutrema salsugineum]ESQ34303.1 hypothetical protein EUTSA_v10009401mg [Eutrema salsugineum]